MKILVLGLGNEILGDDAAGILAARALRERVDGAADVEESSLAGLALLDCFLGYDRALVLDSVRTGRAPAGSIHELGASDLDTVVAPSPHYAGLPEMLALAARLDLDFPAEIRILALEVEDPYTVGAGLSDPVRRALADLVRRAEQRVNAWQEEAARA